MLPTPHIEMYRNNNLCVRENPPNIVKQAQIKADNRLHVSENRRLYNATRNYVRERKTFKIKMYQLCIKVPHERLISESESLIGPTYTYIIIFCYIYNEAVTTQSFVDGSNSRLVSLFVIRSSYCDASRVESPTWYPRSPAVESRRSVSTTNTIRSTSVT